MTRVERVGETAGTGMRAEAVSLLCELQLRQAELSTEAHLGVMQAFDLYVDPEAVSGAASASGAHLSVQGLLERLADVLDRLGQIERDLHAQLRHREAHRLVTAARSAS